MPVILAANISEEINREEEENKGMYERSFPVLSRYTSVNKDFVVL